MKFCPSCSRKFEAKSAYCPYDGRKLVKVSDGEEMVGRLIDNKYQIEARIARGGTGTVYRALHLQLNVPVAIKILHGDRISDATAVERFRREAFAAMQVRHPNAIAVLDFGVSLDNVVYVVMELLSGVTLRQRLKQQCFTSLMEVNTIMQQICAAVAVAHKRKIVHRDLKPENVFLLDDNGEEVVRVLDFGLAKLRGIIDGDSPEITRDGLVIGTPLYMSPEQSRGRPVDKRSDIYSLGIMLYEMLTGQLPFRGPSLTALAVKHATEAPRPVYELRPELPSVINAVVMHALEKSPKRRPASVVEWAAELEAAVKAVTEGEFRSIFLTASDHDLEAAVLLTGTPGKLPPQGPETGNLTSPLTGELSPRQRVDSQAPTAPITNPLANVSVTVAGNIIESVAQSAETTPEKNPNLPRLETMPLPPEFVEQLHEKLLTQVEETAMLLQIVAGDLSAKTPLDRVFFNELDQALQMLRDTMAQVEKTFPK